MRVGEMIDELIECKENPYGPSFYQIGVYCASKAYLDEFVDQTKDMGYEDWVFDTAKHGGEILNPNRADGVDWTGVAIKAHMAFNYEIAPDMEFELMYYEPLSGGLIKPHPFHEIEAIHRVCLSYRVECTWLEERRLWEQFGMRPTYRFVSYGHTNPNIKGKARYRDTMYDTMDELGYNIRFSAKLSHHTFFLTYRGGGSELNWIMWNELFKTEYPMPMLRDNDWYDGCGRDNMNGVRELWIPPEHQEWEDSHITGVRYD